MNLKLILAMLSNASAVVETGKKALELLKTAAAGAGATQADVQAAVDRGRAAADAADATNDRISDRLDREGK